MPTTRATPALIDALLACAVTGSTAVAVALADEPGSRPAAVGAYLTCLLLGGAVLLRRRHPVAMLLTSAAVLIVYHAIGWPAVGFWPLAVALFSAAAAGYGPMAAGVAGVMVANAIIWRALIDDVQGLQLFDELVRMASSLGVVVALGVVVHGRRRVALTMQQRLDALELERAEAARRRQAEHRLAMAHEVHDVVTHTLAVVGLNLHLAEEALADDPAAARTAITDALRVQRSSMGELRSMIHLLRAMPTDQLPRRPAPLATDVADVVDEARRAGLTVKYATIGDLQSIPPTIGLAVYRIVQESLTNVVRHAPGAAAEVIIEHGAEAVVASVRDDGPGRAEPSLMGNGLTGMRERVVALGGRLLVQTKPGHGFSVQAVLPMPVER